VPPSPSIVLEYSSDGQLTINKQPVAINQLQSTLADTFRERRDKTLFISADGSLPYGRVVRVIDAAKGAGVARVGVITESMRAAVKSIKKAAWISPGGLFLELYAFRLLTRLCAGLGTRPVFCRALLSSMAFSRSSSACL
jgi:hypothetical protein